MSPPRWTSFLAFGLAGAVSGALLAGSSFPMGAQEVERNPPPEARVRAETRLVPQRQWEYKQLPCAPTAPAARERGDFAEKLNEDGKRGWELVSLVQLWPATGRECLLATFKRQVLN
jgi:hypothetical protein